MHRRQVLLNMLLASAALTLPLGAYATQIRNARLWRTNDKLHAYYSRRGWTYVRDVDQPHRSSGTLFQLPPEPMPADLAPLIVETPS